MTEAVEVTLARLEERIKTLSSEVRHVHEEVSDLKAQANRWKGAFWVIIGLRRRCRRTSSFVYWVDEMTISRASMGSQMKGNRMKKS